MDAFKVGEVETVEQPSACGSMFRNFKHVEKFHTVECGVFLVDLSGDTVLGSSSTGHLT
jgi:hypothetical protein